MFCVKFFWLFDIYMLRFIIDYSNLSFLIGFLMRISTVFAISVLLSMPVLPSQADASLLDGGAQEYVFAADNVVYDDKYNITVAAGNVEVTGIDEAIRADTITFFEKENKILAEGNVVLTDKDGNQFYTDSIELNNEGENVIASGIEALMSDRARLKGREGQRNDEIIEVTEAYYTPCEPCEKTGDVPWSLQADKVTHNAEGKYFEYENAWMELYGVPVMWTPYFTHPDHTVKRKSGLVKPTYGFKSDLGWIVGGAYYWSIADDMDMTYGFRMTGDQGAVGDVEYRQRFERGELQLRASYTNSDRKKDVGGYEVLQKDKDRGHIEGKLTYHIDDKWRVGFDIFRATDDQYATLYDYSDEDVFENRVYAERFSDRDYSSAELLYFQDTRLGIRADQPAVLPWLEHDVYTDPSSVYGGRLHMNASFLSLQRSDGQDVTRLSLLGDWERRVISETGLVTTAQISAAADASYTNERFNSSTDPLIDASSFDGRFYPQFSLKTSYPVSKRLDESQLIVEPIVGFIGGTELESNYNDIPNEDSTDILFGWSNLFSANRFPGHDRVEDGARFNYGLRTGVNYDSGSYASVYAGQSYRVSGDNIYPVNAGLDDNSSDIVGGFQLGFNPYVVLDYNAQIDNHEFTLRRHEIRMASVLGNLHTNLSYFYDKSVVGTNLASIREQVRPSMTWYLADDWRVNATALYDLSPSQDGLIKASGALGYYNDCFDVNLGMNRNLIDDATGESEFELMLTLGFKNLGSFNGPSFSTE